MRVGIGALVGDVMARLGEIAGPCGSPASGSVACPEDIVALRARSFLGEEGSRLILEAPAVSDGSGLHDSDGMRISEPAAMRLMPCGLYGAEVRLPDGFLRLASVRMASWRKGVDSACSSGSAQWHRQWSSYPGIAGCPEAPRAYVDSDSGGLLLRAVGSAEADDALEWLTVWPVPSPDEEGCFHFPAALYPRLVGAIAGRLLQ